MKLALAVVLCALSLSSCAAGPQALKAWEFERAGDTLGWQPTHAVAPLEVAGGVMRAAVTGGDPYLCLSPAKAFEIRANDYQYLELRMRVEKGTSAEFFWASSPDGEATGFFAGKERGFPVVADGEFHTYVLYPMWSGIITSLRLDLPDAGSYLAEVDYLRLMQNPVVATDPKATAWDLSQEGGGWVAMSGGTQFEANAQGATTALTGETATLAGPRCELDASGLGYAFVELTSDQALSGQVLWSSTDDGSFPACNAAPFAIPAGTLRTNVKLSDVRSYSGALKRVGLSLAGPVGAKVTVKSVALGAAPQGPAQLVLDELKGREALCARGQRGTLLAKVTNTGGEALAGATVTARVVAGPARLGKATQKVPSLAPGQSAELSWGYTAGRDGVAQFAVSGEGASAQTEVSVCGPFLEPKPAAGPQAWSRRFSAGIGNEKVALVVATGAEGYAYGRLYAFADGKARCLAALPAMAALALEGDSRAATFPLQSAKAGQEGEAAVLTLSGATEAGGAQIRVTVILKLAPGKGFVDVSHSLSADKPVKVAAFRGPWLWAGEGSFGDEQDMALFPGLEYLEKGERSSSTLDIAPPGNVRWAPHPNMVTVPSMAVEKDGGVVGLMWEPLQKWDGANDRPTAVFASPNFVEGRNNHLMGLCLPSIPEWLKPNTLLAAKPYELAADKPLTLASTVYAEGKGDVLRSMDLWLERYGTPPLPPKARSYEDTIAMAMKSYTEVLWRGKDKGWMPVLGWTPGLDQSVALTEWVAGRTIADEALAKRAMEQGLSVASPRDLGWALHRFGQPCLALQDNLTGGRGGALGVPEDGLYGFQPSDDQRRSLGVEGESASGLCARGISGVLGSAMVTGDLQTFEGARKTLEALKGFKVPRASQVWEVPVHVPDILASSDVCRVYLDAYELTGDPQWLQQAVYWARTGIPFIYMWRAPEQRELMAGATIPVFGATFYTGSWFGVPVQWCGLAYANTLLRLAKFDESLPWRHFAEMIVISGINQQSTREADYGCYTDNWNMITDAECTGCMLSPSGLLQPMLALGNLPVSPQPQIIRVGGKPVSLTSGPRVNVARLQGKVLDLKMSYFPGETAYTVMMPVAEPVQVELDGAELARRPGAIDTEQGWSYQPDLGCLTLKLKYAQEPRNVRVVGLAAITPQAPEPQWEFNQSGDACGWTAASGVAPLVVKDGLLQVRVTGPDPFIVAPGLGLDASVVRGVVVRLRTTAPDMQVFFSVAGKGFGPERYCRFRVPADGEFHEARVDMRSNGDWDGIIDALRLDFAEGNQKVEVDWVRLLTGDTVAP